MRRVGKDPFDRWLGYLNIMKHFFEYTLIYGFLVCELNFLKVVPQ